MQAPSRPSCLFWPLLSVQFPLNRTSGMVLLLTTPHMLLFHCFIWCKPSGCIQSIVLEGFIIKKQPRKQKCENFYLMVDSTAVTRQVHLACEDQKTLKYSSSGKNFSFFFPLRFGIGSHKWFSLKYSRSITKLTMEHILHYRANIPVQDLK